MSASDPYRILIPSEYQALLDAIPQEKHEILVKLMMNTGARYRELVGFADNLMWFDAKNRAISLPEAFTKTGEKRTIHLTQAFTHDLEKYLKRNKTLEFPARDMMNQNLKRWWIGDKGTQAPHVRDGMPLPVWSPTSKTFRKTWESYLLATGHDYMAVCCNMGHSPQISYNHYANLDPRLKSCMDDVKKLVEGWMT